MYNENASQATSAGSCRYSPQRWANVSDVTDRPPSTLNWKAATNVQNLVLKPKLAKKNYSLLPMFKKSFIQTLKAFLFCYYKQKSDSMIPTSIIGQKDAHVQRLVLDQCSRVSVVRALPTMF